MRRPWFRERDNCWYVHFHGKQKKLGYDEHGATRKNPPPDITEAWHKLERIGDHKDILFSEVAELYRDSMKNPKTAESTKWFLEAFSKSIGTLKVSQLRIHHISDFLKTRTTWGSSTQADCVERICSALSFAQKEGYIDSHRIHYARGQKPKRKKRIVVVEPKHSEMMEAAANPNLARLLRAFRLTGCRPQELCTADIGRVDFKNGVMLVINKTRHKTGVEYRPVYMSSAVAAIVNEAIGERKEGFLFLNTRGTSYNVRELAKQVRMLRIKLKLPDHFFPYALRHSFASHAINHQGVSVAHAARLMGHVDLSQMAVYFHEDHEKMKESAEKAGK